jgi:hypothetical protein
LQHIQPNPEDLAVVAHIRASGRTAALATNRQSQQATYMKEGLGYGALFDQMPYSLCRSLRRFRGPSPRRRPGPNLIRKLGPGLRRGDVSTLSSLNWKSNYFCELGFAKPDAPYLNAALQRWSLKPGEALFIDHHFSIGRRAEDDAAAQNRSPANGSILCPSCRLPDSPCG